MNKEQLLGHLQGEEERQIGALVVDLAQMAWETDRPQNTEFFDPHQRKVAQSVLGALAEVGVSAVGGYPKAERTRLVIYPRFYFLETTSSPIRVLEAEGQFSFYPAQHGDFLGSLLGTGLRRGKIGDILLRPQGCQVVVAREAADYLLANWNQVHRVPIRVKEIDPEQLAVEPERIKEIRSTVASLRLDAVATVGFGTSRTKMVREIKGEKVRLNWKDIANPAAAVSEGDVISVRGRGRVLIHSVGGTTRKGRTNLILHRYF